MLVLNQDRFHSGAMSLLPTKEQEKTGIGCRSNGIFNIKIGSRSLTLMRWLITPLFFVSLTACSSLDMVGLDGQSDPRSITEAEKVESFAPDTLYDLLVAEVAGHNQRYDLALGNYLQQAHKTSDAGIAERAYQIASFIGAYQAAMDAANLWARLDNNNSAAQLARGIEQARSGLLLEATNTMVVVMNLSGRPAFEFIALQAATKSDAERTALLLKFDEVIEQHPADQQLMLSKAMILQQNKVYEPALKLAGKVLSNDSGSRRALLLKGRLLHLMERNDEALKLLASGVEQHPESPRIRLLFARVLVKQGDLTEAQQQFRILAEQQPGNAELLLSVAVIAMENNMPGEARSYLRKLRELSGRRDIAEFYLGQLSEQLDDWRGAREHYMAVSGEQLVASYAALTRMLADRDQWPQARKDLGHARKHHPRFAPQFYLMEAEVLIEQRSFDEASDIFGSAIDQFPQNINLLYARSMLAEKMDDLPQLEIDLRSILELEPDNAAALNALGYTLADQTDRYEEARKLVSEALALRPEDPAILDSMGWVEFRNKNYTSALNYLQQAYAKFPDAEVAAHLGEVLWVLGRQDEARKIWAEAQERQPDSEVLKTTMERLQSQSG